MNWLIRIFKPQYNMEKDPVALELQHKIREKEMELEHTIREYELKLEHKNKELNNSIEKIKELEDAIKLNHYDQHLSLKHNIINDTKPKEIKKLSKQEQNVYDKYLEFQPSNYEDLSKVTQINTNNLRQIKKR